MKHPIWRQLILLLVAVQFFVYPDPEFLILESLLKDKAFAQQGSHRDLVVSSSEDNVVE